MLKVRCIDRFFLNQDKYNFAIFKYLFLIIYSLGRININTVCPSNWTWPWSWNLTWYGSFRREVKCKPFVWYHKLFWGSALPIGWKSSWWQGSEGSSDSKRYANGVILQRGYPCWAGREWDSETKVDLINIMEKKNEADKERVKMLLEIHFLES